MFKKLFIFLFLNLITLNAYCCDCSEKPSIQENWKLADQVFIGKVLKVDSLLYSEYGQRMYAFTIKISKTYKGGIFQGNNLKTILAVSSGSCDYYFDIGKEYLIYAKRDYNALGCSICSRTDLLQNVKEIELEELGKLYEESKKSNKIQIIKFQNDIEYQTALVKNSFEEEINRKEIIIYVLSGLCFLLVALLFVIIRKNKK
ncbi:MULTISPECIES: hypothetical protein [Flavobacterium]|uniref:hypothetical protein n=1 Tax=Flavobacterium TaxID=237 RepID=UPI00211598F9|nr:MULTISPECIES: hypothetical protein [Flavobacterium]UUF15768.1 hypothetical protein NLJ00_06525 [Flavobacterium panici]